MRQTTTLQMQPKFKLFRRGVLHHNDQRCTRSCNMNEDKDHLLIRCDIFDKI